MQSETTNKEKYENTIKIKDTSNPPSRSFMVSYCEMMRKYQGIFAPIRRRGFPNAREEVAYIWQEYYDLVLFPTTTGDVELAHYYSHCQQYGHKSFEEYLGRKVIGQPIGLWA